MPTDLVFRPFRTPTIALSFALAMAAGRSLAQGIPLPAPEPGNPESLVRVLYVIPTDRQPADPTEFDDQVATATARIRTALEAIDDFYVAEQERFGTATPGETLNLERGVDGQIRVLAVRGTKPTSGTLGYWGDTTGLNDVATFFNVVNDVFGNSAAQTAASTRTAYIILPDTLAMDGPDGSPSFRGYMGRGTSFGTAGHGGVAMMVYGVLELLDQPAGTAPADYVAALGSSLCSSETFLSFGGFTGTYVAPPPSCEPSRALQRGELVSLYLGVLAHEALHAFRFGHDGYTPDGLMGSGYPRIGEALREIYAMPSCPDVVLTSAPFCFRTQLGEYFSRFATNCPYFRDETITDKVNPLLEIAWPPAGYFNIQPEDDPTTEVTLIGYGDDLGGEPLNFGLFYRADYAFDDALFGGGQTVAGVFDPGRYGPFMGREVVAFAGADGAGNLTEASISLFGVSFDPFWLEQTTNGLAWVRRPPGEDDRARNGSAPLGSFANPYGDIQTAIDARRLAGFGTVVIGRGSWPIASALGGGKRGVSITGEGVGETILDGGGGSHAIFLDQSLGSDLEENALANLVFQNAEYGIRKTNSLSSFNYTLSNCVFTSITQTAVELPFHGGNITISGNTIAHCGAGIRLANYTQFTTNDRLVFRNNIVAYCTGEGIRVDGFPGLYDSPFTGYNLSYGNGIDFVGNGDGASDYANIRLPGELNASPEFQVNPPVTAASLALRGYSPAVRTAHPGTAASDGSPRDRGAFLGTVPCVYGVDASALGPLLASGGTSGPVAVATTGDCAWDVTGLPAWASVDPVTTQPAFGNATVQFEVTANALTTTRTATLQVAGTPVTLEQAGVDAGIDGWGALE